MKDLDTDQALRDIIALVDHAREKYPHFESPRGVADITRAEQAIAAFVELLEWQESMEQTVYCVKCNKQMFEAESWPEGNDRTHVKHACPACGATVEIVLEPSD